MSVLTRKTLLIACLVLAAIGIMAAVIPRRWVTLQIVRIGAKHPSLSRIIFNRFFRARTGHRNRTGFIEAAVRSVRPGKALDVTMGQGRNAVFLAQLGWEVTGFDIAEEALARAHGNAAQAGVQFSTIRSTSEGFDYGSERWDLLVLSYAWVPISDPAFIVRLKASLRKGGLVVFEHFLHDRPEATPREAGAPEPGELRRLFRDFEIRQYEEATAEPDWDAAASGRAPRPLVRMVAEKR